LSEVNADYLRLWQPAVRNHVDVRDTFVDKNQIAKPTATETPVGNGEVEVTLDYDAPTNEQVPGLRGLLDYLEQQYPAGCVNKYYTINRRQKTELLGDTHVFVRKTAKSTRNVQLNVETFAPTLLQRTRVARTQHLRVNVETFAPTLLQRTRVTQKITRPIYIFAPL
jgi:hypothetical protein